MRITFIGAGNVATHLAQALMANGNEITQVYSRTEQSAKLLADKVAATYTTSLADVRADTDMFIISVCDDAIAHIINAIGPLNDNAIYAHTAGSVPMDILRGHATRYGVMYTSCVMVISNLLIFIGVYIYSRKVLHKFNNNVNKIE